ncbi:MAG: hypothetical protein IPM38_09560 [Ignavibacteria bacterium]|nr:hypothetical protein [Ignavibacteria bacterium]
MKFRTRYFKQKNPKQANHLKYLQTIQVTSKNMSSRTNTPQTESAETAASAVPSDQPELNSGAATMLIEKHRPPPDLRRFGYIEGDESFTIKKTFPGKSETENDEIPDSQEENQLQISKNINSMRIFRMNSINTKENLKKNS